MKANMAGRAIPASLPGFGTLRAFNEASAVMAGKLDEKSRKA
jgi:hypothetical protein